MIPTLFGISLVVFCVINLAPGSPAMLITGSQGGQVNPGTIGSKESVLIFKRQWNLDKPVILNPRGFALDEQDVSECIDLKIRGTAGERMSANEKLEDLWLDSVPHLLSLLEKERALDHGTLAGDALDRNVQRRLNIINFLTQNAKRRVVKVRKDEEADDYTDGQKLTLALNDEFGKERARFDAWKYLLPKKEDLNPVLRDRLERNWIDWFRGSGKTYPPCEAAQAVVARARELAPKPGMNSSARAKAAKEAAKALADGHGKGAVRAVVEALLASPSDDALWQELTPVAAELVKTQSPLPADATPEESKAFRTWWNESMVTASMPDIQKKIKKDSWKEWWEGAAPRFEKTTLDKVRDLFLDTRFANYISKVVLLDFGDSIQYKGVRVLDLIAERLKVSMTFAILGFIIAYVVSIPIGIYSAVYKDSILDRIITVVLFMLYALPSFYVATILLTYLTTEEYVAMFPTGGFESPGGENLTTFEYIKDVAYHLVLPILCYEYASLATLSRYARVGLLEVIRSDYVRTARAKGLSGPVVVLKHALRNGVIPLLTMIGGILPALIGGSVIIESVFNINGMGKLMFDSIMGRDYTVVMADALIAAFLVLIGILVSDLTYVFVDPRITFD